MSAGINTAFFPPRLGQTDGARTDVLERAKLHMTRMDKDGVRPPFRFPGFMGSPHDSMPDNDGPANMMVVLQEMLLQNGEHGELLLLQAWPREWDAKFNLHAHRLTTIEGEVKGGKLTRLVVTPPQRAKDVLLPVWAK
jgi:hypothetical protein